MLARLDAGQCKPQRQTVALDELLRTTWSTFVARAELRGLRVVWQVDTKVKLDTDPALLSLVLRNLLDNAVSYADDNGQIEINASFNAGIATVNVRNSASGLPLELAERAFDRFWRADASRADTGEHAELGLSLCGEAARVLGWKLTVVAYSRSFAASPQFNESSS